MKRLYLVRHGEAVGGQGRAIGHFDPPLSEPGARAVAALAATWRSGIGVRLFTSDLRRAAESAAILARRLQAVPAVDPRLRELAFGEWEGLSWDEIHHRDAARLAQWGERWWETAPPGGESFSDLSRRALAWFHSLEPGGDVVAVAHAGSFRALLAGLLDLPRSALFDLRLDYAHASALRLEGGSCVPLFINRQSFQEIP